MKFFITPEQIKGNIINIQGDDVKHIKTVLRAQKGDTITLCDCKGTDYLCEITDISSDEIKAKIVESIVCSTEPALKITLFQGIPKGNKMETIIQKCVELGVYNIVPVMTKHVLCKPDSKEAVKIERWQKVSKAASKQSGRCIVPEIGNIISFKDAVLACKKLSGAIMPYEKEDTTSLRDFLCSFKGESLGLIVGPEGGFSPEEASFAKNNGITTLTLGKRILRTETAGMACAAVILYELE